MHQSLARCSAPVSFVHARSWADFITTTVGFKVFGTHRKAESQPAPSGIDRTWRATVAIATGGAPHQEDAQARTIGYFFLCKFSVTVWSRGKCAWSNCGADSAIHW